MSHRGVILVKDTLPVPYVSRATVVGSNIFVYKDPTHVAGQPDSLPILLALVAFGYADLLKPTVLCSIE